MNTLTLAFERDWTEINFISDDQFELQILRRFQKCHLLLWFDKWKWVKSGLVCQLQLAEMAEAGFS